MVEENLGGGEGDDTGVEGHLGGEEEEVDRGAIDGE